MKTQLPQPVVQIIVALEEAGFEAHIVGGSLRDLLLGHEPKDWDVTTNAKPDEILKLFPDSVYENEFGTVGVKVPSFNQAPGATADESLQPSDRPAKALRDIVEVTTYRTESGYTNQRHPDQVTFVKTLEEDLARRDFTVNAMAASIMEHGAWSMEHAKSEKENSLFSVPCSVKIVDPFGGQKDLKEKILRAVGEPEARFGEDALRMLRAVRLLVELGGKGRDGSLDWRIEEKTLTAIINLAPSISRVAFERIRDEFSRIILSPNPHQGVDLLHQTGLLKHILPELEEGVGVAQNLHHIYTVWEHNLRALETCPSPKLSVRLAALLHDVGKPRTKRGEGYRSTFYNHDHVGARMTEKILTRLRYPKKVVDHATLLVDQHLFYYNVGEVTEASVRRLIHRVGLENMDDLMAVRIGDRLGSGVPKAKPYKLRHLEYMIDKVSRDALSVKMLKVNGEDLMKGLGEKPGPKIGALLDCLLAEVIEDQSKNTREQLLDRARELMDNDLHVLRAMAKERIEEKRESEDRAIKGKHRVT